MERKEKLMRFLAFLKEKVNFNFDKNAFEDRIKLQKYVHIARFCGLDLGYNFSLYIRGPYSTDLADDYYEITCPTGEYTDLDNFDTEKFLRVVKDRDLLWLEIASTILSVRESNKNISEERLIKIVAEIKNRDEKQVAKILSELKTAAN